MSGHLLAVLPLDLLHDAVAGTTAEWVALVILLPLAGAGAAWSWGPGAAVAARRALVVVLADIAVSLALAWPTNAGPLLVASLPVAGAALPPAGIGRRPIAWLASIPIALPALVVNHAGPHAFAPLWFLGVFGIAALRGLVEPAAARARNWLDRVR